MCMGMCMCLCMPCFCCCVPLLQEDRCVDRLCACWSEKCAYVGVERVEKILEASVFISV